MKTKALNPASLAALLLASVPLAQAQGPFQAVAPNPPTIATASSGTDVQFALDYTTSNGNTSLPGLGLRMHWNSALLTFQGKTSTLNMFTTDLAEDTTCQPDTDDVDADPATDCFVNTAWVNVDGNWPNVTLPALLYEANFQSNLGPGLSTEVNFTTSGNAAGYEFQATSVIISAPTLLCGDADGNGSVTIVDALAVARHVAGLSPPPTVNPAAADVNGDGVNIVDALLIARYVAGLDVPGTCFAP
jgi:hypothetical protein